MRKQYHLRRAAEGLLAWDVSKLLRLTESLPIEEVALTAIAELDENYWYEDAGAKPSCRSIAEHMRLVQDCDLAYPIILCPAGRLMDGMHRVLKALLLGHGHIRAYRLPELPAPDYVNPKPEDLPYDDD